MSVDTLSLARELRAADFALPQAEAIAAAIGRSVTETMATKADLFELRAASKADVASLSTDLRIEIAKLDTKIESSTNKLLFWFIGTQLAMGGLVLAGIKFLTSHG